MKRLLNVLVNVATVLTVLVAIAVLALPAALGIRPVAVLSGSMEPTLRVGGVALMERVNQASVKVGDIITFKSPGDPKVIITHRVIQIVPSGTLTFQTKGDAVAGPDPFVVPADTVVGKVRFSVPGVGYFMHDVARLLRTPMGLGMTMGLSGMFLLVSEVRDILHLLRSSSSRRARLRRKRADRLKKRWPQAARRLA